MCNTQHCFTIYEMLACCNLLGLLCHVKLIQGQTSCKIRDGRNLGGQKFLISYNISNYPTPMIHFLHLKYFVLSQKTDNINQTVFFTAITILLLLVLVCTKIMYNHFFMIKQHPFVIVPYMSMLYTVATVEVITICISGFSILFY